MDAARRTALRGALALAAMLTGGPTMAIEEPAFTVVESAGRIEVRDYAPFIVAETEVEGDLSTASNRGFRAIAGYIFGANRSTRGADGAERIAMTAPVTAEPASEKIAMTAPVTVEPQDAGAADALAQARRWRIHFVMPRQYTMATLPRPLDPAVTLREVPGGRWAVLVFSGLAGESKVRDNTAELLAWVAARGLQPAGAPQLARYDPPWTLPFLRRNEVLVPLVATR